jgi:hypothetical protein
MTRTSLSSTSHTPKALHFACKRVSEPVYGSRLFMSWLTALGAVRRIGKGSRLEAANARLGRYTTATCENVGSSEYVLRGVPTPSYSLCSESSGSSAAARIAGMLLASTAAPISATHTAA